MSINRVVLSGRLTRDAELRALPSGTSVLSIRFAFNTRGKNAQSGQWEDQPNYIDVSMFGDRAERLQQYLTKGTHIGVDGRLRWREWEANDGSKRSAIDIVADDIEFLGGRDDSGGSTGSGGGGTAFGESDSAPVAGTANDEEIPF